MFEWEIVGVAFSVDEFLKYNFYQFTEKYCIFYFTEWVKNFMFNFCVFSIKSGA